MYKSFYGLAEAPFNLTPDSKFLFMSRRHEEALQALIYGIGNRKGFICLTGEIGSGKTTLLRRLLGELDSDKVQVAIILNSYLDDLELLKSINEEFGLPGASDSKKELLGELNAFLVEQYRAGNNCVLIIDEAQNLRPETLEQIRMISNLETETDKLIQIVLVGQPELRRTLALPELEQLNQRITVRYHVTALDENEVLGYISHRLRVARAQVNVEFTPQAIRLIYHYSKGVPRRINVICDHCLLVGYVMSRYDIDGEMVQRAVDEVRGEAGSSPEADEVAAEQPPRRSFTRPLVSAGAAVGLVAAIGGALWFGGEIKNFVQSGRIGWVTPVSALTEDRLPQGEAEAADPIALNELPVAPAESEASAANDFERRGWSENIQAAVVNPAPAPPSGSGAPRPAEQAAVAASAASVAPAVRQVSAMPRSGSAPTPVAGQLDLLLNGDLKKAAEKAAKEPKPWTWDRHSVLRVNRPEQAAPAAYINLLSLWKLQIDLEPFASAPADQVALYDMPAMVRQLDFATCQTNVLDEALRLDLPMLIRLIPGEDKLGPVVAVRRMQGETLEVLDPLSGVHRISRGSLDGRVLEITVLYRDPDGWSGLEMGDRGKQVESLQRRLIELGYLEGDETDGKFGSQVSQALRKFQSENNLLETGRVDPMTAARISARSDLSRPRLII